MAELAISIWLFAKGIFQRVYIWIWAVLDRFDIYGKFKPEAWPKIELTPMGSNILLFLLIGIAVILAYHDVRKLNLRSSEEEDKLRRLLIKYMKRDLSDAFGSLIRYSYCLYQPEYRRILEKTGDPDFAAEMARRGVGFSAPDRGVLQELAGDGGHFMSLPELERVFLSAMSVYTGALVQVQEIVINIDKIEDTEEKRQFEEEHSKLIETNQNLKTRFAQIAQSGRFKILESAKDNIFSHTAYSRHGMQPKYILFRKT